MHLYIFIRLIFILKFRKPQICSLLDNLVEYLFNNIDKFTQTSICRIFKTHLKCETEIIINGSEEFKHISESNQGAEFILEENLFIIPFSKNQNTFFYVKLENLGFDAMLFVKRVNDIWCNFLNPLETINDTKLYGRVFNTMSKKILLLFDNQNRLFYMNKEIPRNIRSLFNFQPKKINESIYKLNEIFEIKLDLLSCIKKTIDKATKEGKFEITLEGEYSEWTLFLNFDLKKNLSNFILIYDWENKATTFKLL